MNGPRATSIRILRAAGAILLRQNKHQVWRLPGGRNWIMSSTPSDTRGDQNNLSDLRAALGVNERSRKNPDRKPKPGHGGNGKRIGSYPTINPAMAEALLMTGLVERQLRQELGEANNTIKQLRARRDELVAERRACWMCRTRKAMKAWLEGQTA